MVGLLHGLDIRKWLMQMAYWYICLVYLLQMKK